MAERVGIEATPYVRDLLEHYTATELQLQAFEEQRRARQRMTPKGR